MGVQNENPSPLKKVSAEVLREHFRSNYNLVGEQIELMLTSSAQSLKKSLTGLYAALEQEDNFEELEKLGHSIKGVLLNMGEQEWAEEARKIELSAAAGKKVDYLGMIKNIHRGVKDVL